MKYPVTVHNDIPEIFELLPDLEIWQNNMHLSWSILCQLTQSAPYAMPVHIIACFLFGFLLGIPLCFTRYTFWKLFKNFEFLNSLIWGNILFGHLFTTWKFQHEAKEIVKSLRFLKWYMLVAIHQFHQSIIIHSQ